MKFGRWKRTQTIIIFPATICRHREFGSGFQDFSYISSPFILKATESIGSGYLQFPETSEFLNPSKLLSMTSTTSSVLPTDFKLLSLNLSFKKRFNK